MGFQSTLAPDVAEVLDIYRYKTPEFVIEMLLEHLNNPFTNNKNEHLNQVGQLYRSQKFRLSAVLRKKLFFGNTKGYDLTFGEHPVLGIINLIGRTQDNEEGSMESESILSFLSDLLDNSKSP